MSLFRWSPSEILQSVGLLSLGICLLIGLATALAMTVLRRRPADRDALWLATLICVAVLPLILIGVDRTGWTWSMQRPTLLDDAVPSLRERRVLPIPAKAMPDLPASSGSLAQAAVAPQGSLDVATSVAAVDINTNLATAWTSIDWLPALVTVGMLIWLAGTAILSIRLWRGMRQVARVRATVQQVHSLYLDQSLQIAATILRMKWLPTVVASTDSTGPVVVGLFRPIVVLPLEFVQTATADQMTDVLIHECAHIMRHDVWVGLLQRLVQLAFWPHPLIYWMNRQLSQSREEVCDNYVLRRGDEAGYAQTLLELAERYSTKMHPAAALTIINPRWRLEDRVAGLLDPYRSLATQVGRTAFLMMMVVLLVCGGTIAAARWQAPSAGDAVVVNQPADPQPRADHSDGQSIPARELRAERALQEYTYVSFFECPLQDALNYLEDLHHIDIRLDVKSLERRNISPEIPVSLVMTGVPLRSALKLILDPLSLTTKVENGELVVTTRVNTMLSLREWTLIDPPVADIVRFGIKPAELITGLAAVIEPRSWQSNGGRGSIELKTLSLPDSSSIEAFVVHQRLDILFEIKDLLSELKQAIRDPKDVADGQKVESRGYSLKTLHELGYTDVRILQVVRDMCRFDNDADDKPLKRTAKIEGDRLLVTQTKQVHELMSDMFKGIDRPREVNRAKVVSLYFEHNTIRWELSPQYIRDALIQPISVDFGDNPLKDTLMYVEDVSRTAIHIAEHVSQREDLLSRTVTLEAEGEPMGQVLDKLTRPAGLAWYVVYPEIIVVTTREDAAQHLEVRAYRTKELLTRGQTTAGLLQQIQTIEPGTWSVQGGRGRIHALPGVLLVSQTCQVHNQITQLLTQ